MADADVLAAEARTAEAVEAAVAKAGTQRRLMSHHSSSSSHGSHGSHGSHDSGSSGHNTFRVGRTFRRSHNTHHSSGSHHHSSGSHHGDGGYSSGGGFSGSGASMDMMVDAQASTLEAVQEAFATTNEAATSKQ